MTESTLLNLEGENTYPHVKLSILVNEFVVKSTFKNDSILSSALLIVVKIRKFYMMKELV